MTAERRLNSYIVFVTVAIIAAFLTWFIPRFSATKVEEIVGVAVAVLTGTGLREFFITFVEWRLRQSRPFKSWMLGDSFLEGKWVGYYVERSGNKLVIVVVRQD